MIRKSILAICAGAVLGDVSPTAVSARIGGGGFHTREFKATRRRIPRGRVGVDKSSDTERL